jgi:hypothetical protein
MFKFFIIGLSAFVLELASTMYIKHVSDRDSMMIFWAFVGPLITLPFIGYMVETDNWKSRIFMALSQAVGYALGALLIFAIS